MCKPGRLPRSVTAAESEQVQAWIALALERMPFMASMLFSLRVVDAPGLGTFAVDAAHRCYVDFDAVIPKGAASVYGTILLNGAVLASGRGDRTTAETYLDEADSAAGALGSDRNELWTAFGPTNVAIHRANVAAARDDMDIVTPLLDNAPRRRGIELDHLANRIGVSR